MAGLWFSLVTRVSTANKTDCHIITEILLNVALNTINQPTKQYHTVGKVPKSINRKMVETDAKVMLLIRSRVIGLDMMENRIFTLCHMIT